MVPPRHDLWRTVSVDTINSPAKEKVILEPLQRHISVDNLRLTKVSNLRNLETAEQRHMSSMNTVSSVSSINLNTMNKMSRYQHNPEHRQSVESMSGYSDGESPGDGNESDVSTRTQDETPLLPSVKKLASKFNLASQERVNDLDKHETDGTLTFYGKKNIFLSDKSPTEQPYSRNFTNNLNKRTEKPYNIKEVRSLPNNPATSSNHKSPTTNHDTHTSDPDDSEFDDQATITSISLPPTPYSLDGRLSISTSSLLDSDSVFSSDFRDLPYKTSPNDEPGTKTIFGVTLRKVTPSISSSRGSQSHGSLSSISSDGGFRRQSNGWNRHLSSSSSLADFDGGVTPGYTDSDSDTHNALRQVTIIKVQDKNRPEYQSLTDISMKGSSGLISQKKFNSTLDLTTGAQTLQNASSEQNRFTNKFSLRNSQILPKSRRESMPDLSIPPGSAFAYGQKGKRKSMHEFLKSYRRQMSLNEINRIDEKVEEEFGNQRSSNFIGQQKGIHLGEPKPSAFSKSPLRKTVSNNETISNTADIVTGQFTTEYSNTVGESKDVKSYLSPTKNNTEGLVIEDNCDELNLTNELDSETSSLSGELTIGEPLAEAINLEKYQPERPADEIMRIENEIDSNGNGSSNNTDTVVLPEQSLKTSTSIPLLSNSSVTDGKPMTPLQRKTSMGDFLKLYSNISSLSEKSAFKPENSTVKSNAGDKNRTVITISNSVEAHIHPKQVVIQSHDSPKKTVIKPKASPQKTVTQSHTSPEHSIRPQANLETRKKDSAADSKLSSVTNPLHLDKGADHQTIITLSGASSPQDHGNNVYHASIVYVGDESDQEPRENYPTDVSIMDAHANSNVDSSLKYSIPPVINRDNTHNRDANEKGTHVTVISVEEPLPRSPVSPASDTAASLSENLSGDSEGEFDPIALTRKIVSSSRLGNSNKPLKSRKVNIAKASIPSNSPFSPVSKSKVKTVSKDGNVRSPSDNSNSFSFTESLRSTKNLGSQEFNDEGVDFTLSDADLAPSTTESKSTSSLDNIGKEGSETMVL